MTEWEFDRDQCNWCFDHSMGMDPDPCPTHYPPTPTMSVKPELTATQYTHWVAQMNRYWASMVTLYRLSKFADPVCEHCDHKCSQHFDRLPCDDAYDWYDACESCWLASK